LRMGATETRESHGKDHESTYEKAPHFTVPCPQV
jgi:hypothetical protein